MRGEKMMGMFTGTAVWALIRQSDVMTWCVLGALLLMSIVCWTVALYKLTMLRKTRHDIMSAQRALMHIHDHAAFQAFAAQHKNTNLEIFCVRLSELMQEGAAKEQVQQAIAAMSDDLLMREEAGNVILKASTEVAPLLGLLGTIWGLIHSFMRISQEQSADIITVAPGIAEALITTLMGLLVAIPAAVLYHAVYRQLQLLEHDVLLFSETLERVWFRANISARR
jgi:biopolymer transport protein ExbB/TolQ